MTSGEKEWGDFKTKGGWVAGVNCMESVPEQAPHVRKTQLFPLTTIYNMLSFLRGLFSSSINSTECTSRRYTNGKQNTFSVVFYVGLQQKQTCHFSFFWQLPMSLNGQLIFFSLPPPLALKLPCPCAV